MPAWCLWESSQEIRRIWQENHSWGLPEKCWIEPWRTRVLIAARCM